jgi:hypothetical protein
VVSFWNQVEAYIAAALGAGDAASSPQPVIVLAPAPAGLP